MSYCCDRSSFVGGLLGILFILGMWMIWGLCTSKLDHCRWGLSGHPDRSLKPVVLRALWNIEDQMKRFQWRTILVKALTIIVIFCRQIWLPSAFVLEFA